VPLRRVLLLLSIVQFTRLSFPLSQVNAGDGWPAINPEELKMTSVPEAPGAPAVILYRQVDHVDKLWTASKKRPQLTWLQTERAERL
jgi:hypothetical protein